MTYCGVLFVLMDQGRSTVLKPIEWWVRKLRLTDYPNETMSQASLCASQAFPTCRQSRECYSILGISANTTDNTTSE